MKVDCPTCGYPFETTTGLQCPRCGDTISCSSVGCEQCQACSSPMAKLRNQLASKIRFDRGEDDQSAPEG